MDRYAIERIEGMRPSDRREVVFLISVTDTEVNAHVAFGELDEKRDRLVRDRFDYWIDGGISDGYFHGWPNDPANRECFCFRWKQKRQHHRLYGFLHNPQPRTRPRFQICVLTTHATKNDWTTDPHDLGKANEMRIHPCVLAAMAMTFNDDLVKPWLN